MKVVFAFIRINNSQDIDRTDIEQDSPKELAEKIAKLDISEYDVVEGDVTAEEYDVYEAAEDWNNCDTDSAITDRRWVIAEFKHYLNEVGIKKEYFKFISEHWCAVFLVTLEQFKREIDSFKK